MAEVKMDFAEVKPTVISFLIVGIMSALFLYGGKALSQKYYIPGLTQFFASL